MPVEKVQVPDVVGKTQDEATNAITSAGLVVGKVTEEYSDTVPAGKVISQSPFAGTEVDKGSVVDLVISKGKKTEGETPAPASNKVQVPDVVGKTRADAENAITQAGLKVGNVTEDYSDTVPAGKVISQSPSAGTEVEKGSAVDLVISKGKKRRFIVSCGAGNDSGGSYMADMMLLGLVSGLLIARKGRKVMSN